MREISVKSGRPGCLEARVQVTGRDDAAFRLACASPFPNPDQDPQTNHNSHIRSAIRTWDYAYRKVYRTVLRNPRSDTYRYHGPRFATVRASALQGQ